MARIKGPHIARGQYIDVPEGLTWDHLGYRRFLLDTALTKTKKKKGRKYKILIDRRIKDDVRKAVKASVRDAVERAISRVNISLAQETGNYMRTHRILYDNTPLGNFSSGIASMLDGYVTQVVNTNRAYWSTERDFRNKIRDPLNSHYVPESKRQQEGAFVCGGEFIIEILHIRGAVTIFLMKNDSKKFPPGTTTFVEKKHFLTDDGSRATQWDSWMTWRVISAFNTGQANMWMRVVAEDEDLAMLYKEFPGCPQLQRELIFRSRDFHVADELKPVVHWSRIGQIKNVEWRRTLMTIGNIKNYPEMIASDDEGELYPLDFNTKVLKLTCPSTGRVYHLGVPSRCQTPSEARRWTLGLSEGYILQKET